MNEIHDISDMVNYVASTAILHPRIVVLVAIPIMMWIFIETIYFMVSEETQPPNERRIIRPIPDFQIWMAVIVIFIPVAIVAITMFGSVFLATCASKGQSLGVAILFLLGPSALAYAAFCACHRINPFKLLDHI